MTISIARLNARPVARTTTKVFVFPTGQSIIENLMSRGQEPNAIYRAEVMPAVLAQLGLPADTKFSWDRHAGCSRCPCSPGFVIRSQTPATAADVYVDVTTA